MQETQTQTQTETNHTDTNNDILMLSVQEVADLLKITRQAVYLKIKKGALKITAKKINWYDAKIVFASKMIELGKIDQLDLDHYDIESNKELVKMNIEKQEISLAKQEIELELMKKELVSLSELELMLNSYLKMAKKLLPNVAIDVSKTLIEKGYIKEKDVMECKKSINREMQRWYRVLEKGIKETLNKDNY